jgi:phosphoenolpyruvate synthase/pyruvate phosphate dikinase
LRAAKPVIVRLSDFKTNEYATLLGGEVFEPKEENPMLGFRGAARYAHPAYAAGFALECAALRRVRNAMGLTNLRIMIPFCRRTEDASILRTMTVVWDAETSLQVADAPVSVPAQPIVCQAGAQLAMKDDLT